MSHHDDRDDEDVEAPTPARRIRVRRAALGAAAALLVAALAILGPPFPRELLSADHLTSTRIVDRQGRPLREVLNPDEGRARWTHLEQISEHLVAATIHAEDKRFRDHFGVDPIAVARSLWINLRAGEVRTGASTLTQQTAEILTSRSRSRSLLSKMRETMWALRLERTLDKDEILEQYLNRAPYGNQLFGVEAAARMYFAKPASQLSLAEATLLAALPKAPSARDPYRHLDRAREGQRHILDLMLERGAIDRATYERARDEELVFAPRRGRLLAPHFTRHVVEQLGTPRRPERVRTTLDLQLQEAVEGIVDSRLAGLEDSKKITQASAVVLDTRTGEVLSWVGSRDWWDEEHQGANDGVVALRQPGSTLKPFVYSLYLEEGGTAADPIADLPVQYPTPHGAYIPENYSGTFHGPVSVRDALGSSLNIPAVEVTAHLGVAALLERLRALGFASLDRPREHYGLGLSLGNGEVRLLELAAAYATLGRLGRPAPIRTVLERTRPGEASDPPPAQRDDGRAVDDDTRLIDEDVAYLILDILSDDRARAVGFGRHTALNLPYRVAAKTGTSAGYRDNWTVGVTPDYTVAVWVGNFDGTPMIHSSGVTGAAPIMREIFQTLYPEAAGPADVDWYERPETITAREVCAPSGQPAGPRCPCAETRLELFRGEVRGARGHLDAEGLHPYADTSGCPMHRRVDIDMRNGLRAGADCPPEFVETHTVLDIPGSWLEWALDKGIAIAPERSSPLCGDGAPGPAGQARDAGRLRITHPVQGDTFVLQPDARRAEQQLSLGAVVDDPTLRDAELTWFVDGEPYRRVRRPFRAFWPLEPGSHTIGLGRDRPMTTVRIEVR